MDIQSSDGQKMLLKYVTSYVIKKKDHNILQGLIQSYIPEEIILTSFKHMPFTYG